MCDLGTFFQIMFLLLKFYLRFFLGVGLGDIIYSFIHSIKKNIVNGMSLKTYLGNYMCQCV